MPTCRATRKSTSIGRTGRGGEKGLSLTLCAPNEKKWVKLIEDYQGAAAEWHDIKQLADDEFVNAEPAPMLTLCISGGKKEKLRAGDVLGALCGDGGLTKEEVGKITVTEFQTYVALDRRIAHQAFDRLKAASSIAGDFGSFKGRNFKMRFIEV
jgi:ATP-independent RNA helicase DbpA